MLSVYMLTGGAIYAGYKAYRYRAQDPPRGAWFDQVRRFFTPRSAASGQNEDVVNESTRPMSAVPSATPSTTADTAQRPHEGTTNELTVASVTLGLVTTSALVYPPAQVVCLPLLLYLGVDPAQTAYRTWREEGRVTVALAETAVLILCIAQRYYLAGALSCGAYALGKRLVHARQTESALHRVAWQPPTWAWLQQGSALRATPMPGLQAGDIIVVHASEMVPVAGVVTDGVAWVKQQRLPEQAEFGIDLRQVGSKVEAATIVQVGQIWVAVAGKDQA